MATNDERDPQKTSKASSSSYGFDQGLQKFLGYKLRRAEMVLIKDTAQALKPFGFSVTSYSVLTVICDNQDVTVRQIGVALGMENQGLLRVLDRLQTSGMIHQTTTGPRETDRLCEASDLGLRMQHAAAKHIEQLEKKQFDHLKEDEREQLLHLLDRIRRRS